LVYFSILTATLSVLSSPTANVPADSGSRNRMSVLPVPAMGYSPETRAYLGAVCLFSKRLASDTSTRPSNAKIEFNYSQRKQIIGELSWNAFTPGERHFTSGRVHFSRFPDYFWSESHLNDTGSRVLYSANRRFIEFNFLFRITSASKWFAGPAFRSIRYSGINIISGAVNSAELQYNSAYIPAGMMFLKDSRDNILNAAKGWYLQSLTHYYHSNSESMDSYLRSVLDVRTYFQKKPGILALRWKSCYSGGPPLDAAIFGGDEIARGFYAGRYRPRFYSTLQAEFRFVVYKRWGLALFGGSSYLQMNSLNNRFHSYIKSNAGMGIRFVMDRREKINLRLDYALGSDHNSGFYIAFGESF
jgi:hypothetical protein